MTFDEETPPAGTFRGAEIKAVGLVVERSGRLYKAAKVFFGSEDASVYITPYRYPSGVGYAGQLMVPPPGGSNAVNFTRQLTGHPLKLSLHESGRTHAQSGGLRTEPAWGRALHFPVPAHIATVTVFDPVGLPEVPSARTGDEPDIVFETGGGDWTSLHISMHVCPDEDSTVPYLLHATLQRAGGPRPLYLAFNARLENAPDRQHGPGVLVTAGWGPGAWQDQRPLNGVYLLSAADPDPVQ